MSSQTRAYSGLDYYYASPAAFKQSLLNDEDDSPDISWSPENWYSGGPAQLPTPTSPASSMSKSPNTGHMYGTHVSGDPHGVNNPRSFSSGYRHDPREPRTLPYGARYSQAPSNAHEAFVGSPSQPQSFHSQPSIANAQQASDVNGAQRDPVAGAESPLFKTLHQPPSTAPDASDDHATPGQASKSARKAKAHVQAACYNCKRAHLSCDPGRPCQRCVTTGKQDTCIDVPHKKRGRPRLRDNPAKGQYATAQRASLRGSIGGGSGHSAVGHQAYDMYGRYDPMRILRSQTDPYGGNAGLLPGRQTTAQPVYHASGVPGVYDNRGPVNPVAFLNMNLEIVRTNLMFSRIFGACSDPRGKSLEDLVHGSNRMHLQVLKMRLKEEKEMRHFGMLPPPTMGASDNDSIPAVEDVDHQRLTSDFTARSHQFWFHYSSGQMQNLSVEVKLARHGTFFVVLVLPPFMDPSPPQQPPQAPPPPAQMSMYAGMNAMAPSAGMMPGAQNGFAQSMGGYGLGGSGGGYSGGQYGQQQQGLSQMNMMSAHATAGRTSPPPSVSQSPLYTYQPVNSTSFSPQPSHATPRHSYDGSYMNMQHQHQQQHQQQQHQYQQPFSNPSGSAFGAYATTTTTTAAQQQQQQQQDARSPPPQYYLQDPNQGPGMQLPPIGPAQASGQTHSSSSGQQRMMGGAGLMQAGQGIGLGLGGMNPHQYFASSQAAAAGASHGRGDVAVEGGVGQEVGVGSQRMRGGRDRLE